MRWSFAELWDTALTFDEFVADAAPQHRALWLAVHRRTALPLWARERIAALAEPIRLVVLAEDWCGDGANAIPVLARLAEESPNVELRMLHRDEHPAVMGRYLTGGARAIPVVIILTENMEELGRWGPRPSELQAWVAAQRAMGREMQVLYAEIRRWYVRDRGESVLREVMGKFASSRLRPYFTGSAAP